MKIRLGFVTNSSSSSYVIAYKSIPQEEKDAITSTSIKKFIDLLEKIAFGKGEKITTIEELQKSITEQFCYSDINTFEKVINNDEDAKDRYESYLSYIKKGYSIFSTWVDYDDEGRAEMYQQLNDGENFILLECD